MIKLRLMTCSLLSLCAIACGQAVVLDDTEQPRSSNRSLETATSPSVSPSVRVNDATSQNERAVNTNQAAQGIRSVDFGNFIYREASSGSVILRNGRYDGGGETLGSRLDAIEYADFDGDNQEEAVVAIRTDINGSAHYDVDYYVFTYRDGAPHQVFHQLYNKPYEMRIEDRRLIIVIPTDDARNADYYIEEVTYTWRGSGMVFESSRRVSDRF